MKASTRHLLLKLIKNEIEKYESAIYSTNVSRRSGYEAHIKKLQKRISELEKAREDIVSTPASKEDE